MNVEKAWHDFLEKLHALREKAHPSLHKHIDAVAEEAAKLKAQVDAEAVKVAVPVVEDAAKAAGEAVVNKIEHV